MLQAGQPGAAPPLRSPALNTSPVTPAFLAQPSAAQASSESVRIPSTFLTSHPHGVWRFAHPAVLNDVVLWLDQILIRYDGVKDSVSFSLAPWFSVPPPPGRTREQALALAQQVAAAAARDPGSFGELARHYSDDLPSRDDGGALGGLSAGDLVRWPHILDALAVTGPGQTSGVVETRYGFHVFRREPPPREETLSGAHIVIGHDSAEWLKVQARGPLPSRSWEEALALATELAQRARAHPESFRDLVERYSEHRDALVGGDFGSWSTREPNPFEPRMRRLGQLALGEVGAPIETQLGFEVILRTESPARPEYAVRAMLLRFNPAAPDGAEDSKQTVFVRAQALARSYAANPQSFAASGQAAWLLQWQSGRGVPALELQVRDMDLGAVASTAVQSEFAFQISQRVAPQSKRVEYSTELPAPAHADFYHLCKLPQLRELLLQSARAAAATLPLPAETLTQLQQLYESAPFADPDDTPRATAAVDQALEAARKLLGVTTYGRYVSVLQGELDAALLAPREDSLTELGF